MGKISNFYTDGKQTFTKTIGSTTHTFTVTKLLKDLFTEPVTDFDTSICLSYCDNNDRVNTARRYFNSNKNNNFNIAWTSETDKTYYSAYYKEIISGEPVDFIGTALIWADNAVIPDEIMFSLKDLKDGRDGTLSDNLFKNFRFLIDVNGNGLNDLFISWTKSRGNSAQSYTSDDYTGLLSATVKIVKNLMTTTKTSMTKGDVTNISPVLIIKFKDQIYIAPPRVLYPYLNCWEYDANYRYDNFDDFQADITQSTGSDKTWCGAFRDETNTFYLDLLGNIDIPDKPTEFPFTSDTDYVVGLQRYTSSSSRRTCQWLLNPELTSYNENMFGLKWVDSTEYSTPQDLYDKMKLPYMGEYADIDCKKWVTGLDAIKKSDSKNVDMDYDKTPTVDPKAKKGDTDTVDDMKYNMYGTVGGNIRYYRITQSELAKLGQGIQSEDFVNPLQNIVCLNQYPFAVDAHIFNTYGNEDIKIQGKSTGAVGRPVTNYIQYWGVDSINVPNLHNNFLDNSPYTQYELYIPFCGWVQLPDFVHGHTLTITLLNDIITTSVRGLVHCNLNGNNVIVAEKQGSFGTSCPLSSNDEGSKQNALTGALFNTIGGLMSTGFALTTGNAIGTVSGLMSTVSAITQGNIANNNNYVSAVGASGDRTNFANYDKIYLKINTVYSTEPDNYNNTYGRPCNKSGTVSDFTGYTTCSNFDTTGLTCSETEKQMIKNLFETGVYL